MPLTCQEYVMDIINLQDPPWHYKNIPTVRISTYYYFVCINKHNTFSTTIYYNKIILKNK